MITAASTGIVSNTKTRLMQFGQPVARIVRVLSDRVSFDTMSCFQKINVSQEMFLFQPFKRSHLYHCDFFLQEEQMRRLL